LSKDDKNKVNTTGHKWDGDLEEYNNPLPRWWVWIFYLTIIWGIGYTIAYPAWPLVNKATPGLLGFSTRQNVADEIKRFDEMNAEVKAQLASAELTTLAENEAVYSYAIQSGRATFATFCSQCHGSGAAGALGYPNLLDNDWLWGGTIEEIAYSIRHGIRNEDDYDSRYSEMPAFGEDYLSDEEITNVVAYTRGLSGLENEAGDVTAGETVYLDNCASCHMEDGSGDRLQGAPNLADSIWLYGDSFEQVEASVRQGPFGVMPPWGAEGQGLDDAQINGVAAYVHQLGGGE